MNTTLCLSQSFPPLFCLYQNMQTQTHHQEDQWGEGGELKYAHTHTNTDVFFAFTSTHTPALSPCVSVNLVQCKPIAKLMRHIPRSSIHHNTCDISQKHSAWQRRNNNPWALKYTQSHNIYLHLCHPQSSDYRLLLFACSYFEKCLIFISIFSTI